jgi:hypothetical protein
MLSRQPPEPTMTVSFYPYVFDAVINRYIFVRVENETFELSNANASDLLAILGFEDLWSAPPQPIAVFLGHLTTALQKSSGRPSVEIPVTVDQAPGRLTVIDCGRAEGYLNRRLHQLAILVQQSKEAGTTHVGWG